MVRPRLTIEILCTEAAGFAKAESGHDEPSLYGVTDGKAVGTYLEQKFREVLGDKYIYEKAGSARGLDFPDLGVDIKVTSIRQPQSSSPFESAYQKVRGLGYSLLIFIYNKTDDDENRTSNLQICNTIFVDSSRTADYQTTRGVLDIIERGGNADDLIAFMYDRNLPIDDVSASRLADELLIHPPKLGYLTISNALQWRLHYRRVIERAGSVEGILLVS